MCKGTGEFRKTLSVICGPHTQLGWWHFVWPCSSAAKSAVTASAVTGLPPAADQSAPHCQTRNPEVRIVLHFFFFKLHFPYLENVINNEKVNINVWDFPGDPGVRNLSCNAGDWIQSLVGELRSHIPELRKPVQPQPESPCATMTDPSSMPQLSPDTAK